MTDTTAHPEECPAFTDFFRDVEPRLRHALVAGYGPEVGVDAAAEALAYGWMNWGRVGAMENPAGYIYRVGESRAKRARRRPPTFPSVPVGDNATWIEPGLPSALAQLSKREREVIVLVEAMGYSQRDVAQMLHLSASSVQSYQQRGMSKMRRALKVDSHE